MWKAVLLAVLCVCLLARSVAGQDTGAAAYIDINGTDITVRVALTANGAMTNWNASQAGYNFTIYRLPTDHTSDPTRRCEVFASNQFLVETLAAGTSGVVNLPLSTLLMCSIVAVDSATGVMTGCGTIMGDPSTANVIARAVFYQPIGGTLYLLDYGGMDGVKIVGELYSVTGPDIQNSMVTAQLHSGQVSQLDSFVGNCSNIGTPSGPVVPLEILTPVNLAISKNSTLNVSIAVGYTLAVSVDGMVLGCAIVETVSAAGVTHLPTGPAAIEQLLPYFTSSLRNANIATYSVLSEVGPSMNGVCRNPSAVYDPWPGEGSPIGNLASKVQGTTISTPIIGEATIVGHSLNDTQCSFLRPVSNNGRVIMGTADFSGTEELQGTIVLRQVINGDGTFGPTYITVDLTRRMGNMTTFPHNYHVHQRRIAADGTCLGPVGGHYNPFNVNLTQPEYGMECGVENPFRCEMGDLSNKHGQLSIGVPSDVNRPTFSHYDPNLHLFGPYTVLGRSIVIHDHITSSVYLACANINPAILSGTEVTASFPVNGNDPDDVFFRINVANTIASSSNVAMGDVLVYDVVRQTINNTTCLTATLRMTGVDDSAADANARAVMDAVRQGSLGAFSPGACSGSWATATIGISTLIVAVLATLFSAA